MLTVINDCHIGTVRSAGTTLASQAALTAYIHQSFKALLPDDDLMILGDLLDKSQVALSDLLFTYNTLSEWLEKGHTLYLVAGNHDLEKVSGKLSSFDLLGELLKIYFPHTVAVISTAGAVTPYGYVIPHRSNQQLFDAELVKVPQCEVLYLHVNYDNFFAAQSDQSLNISKQQVAACKAKRIVIAHEHAQKVEGKVTIPGCQIPTSISDWQGCEAKHVTTVTDTGTVTMQKVAEKSEDYIEQPWSSPVVTGHKFVKLVGTATAEQAAQVVSAVAKFRAVSTAFVVANGVLIASESGVEGFDESLESVRSFDVMSALGELLSRDEMTVLKELQ